MKRIRLISIAGGLLLTALCLFPAACSKTYTLAPLTAKATPTPTFTFTPTFTPSPTPNGPIIEALFLDINSVLVPGVTVNAVVFIQDANGNPVTTAAVTVSTAGQAVSLASYGSTTPSFPTNIGVTNILSGEYATNTVTYPYGQPCTFTAVFGGVTYTATGTDLNADGGIVTGTSGVTCTWTPEGNDDFIDVTGSDSLQLGPSPAISSPEILPASDFPNDPAGSGNDEVQLDLFQLYSAAFPGCKASSCLVTGIADYTYY